MKYKELVWSDNFQPSNDTYPYDYCTAETPFGQIVISWKGWKKYPQYDIWVHPWEENSFGPQSYTPTGSNLESFKGEVQDWYEGKLNNILANLKEASCDKNEC